MSGKVAWLYPDNLRQHLTIWRGTIVHPSRNKREVMLPTKCIEQRNHHSYFFNKLKIMWVGGSFYPMPNSCGATRPVSNLNCLRNPPSPYYDLCVCIFVISFLMIQVPRGWRVVHSPLKKPPSLVLMETFIIITGRYLFYYFLVLPVAENWQTAPWLHNLWL